MLLPLLTQPDPTRPNPNQTKTNKTHLSGVEDGACGGLHAALQGSGSLLRGLHQAASLDAHALCRQAGRGGQGRLFLLG